MPPSPSTSTFIVGDLEFQVRPSARRRKLELIVERDGSLVIATPLEFDQARAQAFVESKQTWLYTHLAEKQLLTPDLPSKSYVSGEGFFYLGRSHRLLLVDRQARPVKLDQGRLCLVRSQAPRARELLVRWFTARGASWISQRVKQWTERVGARPTGIEVRDLGYRWGSCGKGSILYFHWKTIQLPPDIIDYVIAHELVHLTRV